MKQGKRMKGQEEVFQGAPRISVLSRAERALYRNEPPPLLFPPQAENGSGSLEPPPGDMVPWTPMNAHAEEGMKERLNPRLYIPLVPQYLQNKHLHDGIHNPKPITQKH